MAGRANTQFSVAVHVLTYLAGVDRDHQVSSDELAESANVNPVYVRRVLGPLRHAGIVASRPGAQGGWELVRAADLVHLDEVWTLVNGADPVMATHGPDPNCPVGRRVGQVLNDLEVDMVAAIRRELHARTVADVLDEAKLAPGSVGPRPRP
jgi:Rrf2 family protein